MYTHIVEECGNQLFERQGREESWPRQQGKLRRQGFSRTRASDNGSNWVIREPGIDQQQIEATGIGRNDERSHVEVEYLKDRGTDEGREAEWVLVLFF